MMLILVHQEIYKKCLESSEMWCWRRIEKISWIGRVRNEEVLRTIKGGRSTLVGHILRRSFLLKHVAEKKIEETGRRGRRRKQLLDDFKESRMCWNLKRYAVRNFRLSVTYLWYLENLKHPV
jgi:hypothetical protein